MDILSHALWSSVAAKTANRRAKTKIDPWWAGFWGAFPDLISFTPAALVLVAQIISGSDFRSFQHSGGIGQLTGFLYPASHSLLIFLAVFLIVWLFRRTPAWVMGGWALHIILDIGTHPTDFYPTRFLWPLSEIHFGGISWRTPWFLLLDYALLALCFFLFRKEKGASLSTTKKTLAILLALIAILTYVFTSVRG